MVATTGPTARPPLLQGTIAEADPARLMVLLDVHDRGLASRELWGPCRFTPRPGVRLPQRGDRCLVGTSERDEPYVLWWDGPLPVALGPDDWTADGAQPWQEEWANFTAATNLRFTRVRRSPRGADCFALRTDLPGTDNGNLKIGANPYEDATTHGLGTGRRAELAMANPWQAARSRLHREGDERWFGLSQYLPTQPMLGDAAFMTFQLKAIGGSAGAPSIAIDYRQAGGNLANPTRLNLLLSRTTSPSDTAPWIAATATVPRDRWFRLLLRVVFHRNPTIGGVQLLADLDDDGGWRELSAWLPAPTMREPDATDAGNAALAGWNTTPARTPGSGSPATPR